MYKGSVTNKIKVMMTMYLLIIYPYLYLSMYFMYIIFPPDLMLYSYIKANVWSILMVILISQNLNFNEFS